ncbi:MAG: hypothetical protein AVDCRST_MAG68-596, partial [uncultured Gemmatimonadetes bacterium]
VGSAGPHRSRPPGLRGPGHLSRGNGARAAERPQPLRPADRPAARGGERDAAHVPGHAAPGFRLRGRRRAL